MAARARVQASRSGDGARFGWLAPLLLCCSPSPNHDFEPPTERSWSSAHFRYFSREDDSGVCEPLLDELEHHFDVVQAFLGFTWPAGKRIDYFKFRDAADLREHGTCSDFNESCFFAELGLQTAHAFETHELIHAYLAPLGDRHRLLEEGLADALSCGHELRAKPEALSVEDAFAPERWRTNTRAGFRALYDSAAWFVGWLVNTGGAARFMQIYQRSTPDLPQAEFAWLFEQIYGRPLELAWQLAFATTNPDAGCVRVLECASPAWSSGPQGESCAGETFTRSLELTNPAWVLQRTGGFGSLLGSCDPEQRLPHHDFLDPEREGQRGEAFALLLPEGRYFVTASPRFAPPSVHVFDQVEGQAAASCVGAPPLPVDFGSNLTVAIDASLASTATARWLPWSSSGGGLGYEISCSGGVLAQWCSECGDCTSVCDTHVATSERIQPGAFEVLGISAPSDRGGWVRLVRTH